MKQSLALLDALKRFSSTKGGVVWRDSGRPGEHQHRIGLGVFRPRTGRSDPPRRCRERRAASIALGVEGRTDGVLAVLGAAHVAGGVVRVGEVVDLHLDEAAVRGPGSTSTW